MTSGDELERSEVEAVLETRRDLGLRYDKELVDGFANRVEAEVARRVGLEVEGRRQAEANRRSAGLRQLALAIVTLVAFIPISLPLGLNGHFATLLVTLCALVGVNFAHAWQSRRH